MCGICGVIGIDDPKQSGAIVRRMMGAMVHRGPDGEGLLCGPGAALGMRRLSIIDLPGGNQPVWNETHTCAVLFNGEIYNYRELRAELASLGHKFQTQSDTEVIVHAYESWGEDCVNHLRGMYALALAEVSDGAPSSPDKCARVKSVLLARDRMGIKPLYYAIVSGHFMFSSEVRSLLASGMVPAVISSAGLSSYFLFGSVSEPLTLIDGVRSLPPGSRLFLDTSAPSRNIGPETYWHPAFEPSTTDGAQSHAFSSPAVELRKRLEESVRIHMIADVPLGVFLSSGIDSTALAALASGQRDELHTFTLVFPENDYSEAELARETARSLNTKHAEVALSGEEMLARLDEAAAAFDQPSMDGINTYFVSWGARQAGLKVALSGLGSDELFGGYSTFKTGVKLENIQRLSQSAPLLLRKVAAPAIELLAVSFLAGDAARKASSAWTNPDFFDHAYFYTRTLFPPSQLEQLAGRDLFSGSPEWENWLDQVLKQAAKFETLSQISWLELRTYMLSTLLRDTDAMSMANSLEIRVPFLDHLLVEFAMSLSDVQKFKTDQPKALLIQALQDILPSQVVNQRKRTFTLPWEIWLKDPLRPRVEAELKNWSAHLEPFFPQQSVDRVWRDFLSGRTSWARVWSLFVLNQWVRHHMTSNTSAPYVESRGTPQVHIA